MHAKSPSLVAFESYIDELQARITDAVAAIDGSRFEFTDWTRPEGGGGRMSMLRGPVIEKGAVHVSKISGDTNPLTGEPFYAAGLSLILHPVNPHVPTVHMNVRRFEEPEDAWWGGGMDLTPMGVRHEGDAVQFHDSLRRALGHRYDEGRAEAERYFFIPHRGRERGVGGVFYDHVRSEGVAFIRSIGDAFLPAYQPIIESRKYETYDEGARQAQLHDRGLYVEFNLLYDRGTRFGLQSGGNIEAILSSLPPQVAW